MCCSLRSCEEWDTTQRLNNDSHIRLQRRLGNEATNWHSHGPNTKLDALPQQEKGRRDARGLLVISGTERF